MVECVGMRLREQSFSHWGLFTVPDKLVQFAHEDLGYDPYVNQWCSLISHNGEVRFTRLSADEFKRRGVVARMDVDNAAIESLGIDPTTVR